MDPNARRLAVGAVVVASLAAAVVALALYAGSRPPGNGSPEAGFARDMLVHHAQAVEMATVVADRTEDERMETLARDMTLTQQAQIGQMQGWLAEWGLQQVGPEPRMEWMGHSLEDGEPMPGMASPEELARLREAGPEEADRLFLELMIPHHRSAIPMSEAVLERTERPSVVRLASAIRDAQEGEISVMESMLEERGGSAPPAGEDHSEHGGGDHSSH